jgi:CHASE3 domain sensor protein
MKRVMKPLIERKLFPALLLVAIDRCHICKCMVGLQSVGRLATNRSLVARSWQVVHQVERVLGSALDAETGERGYLISGSDSYLEPYTIARRELPPNWIIYNP